MKQSNILLLFILIATGCYKDKGNYTYKQLDNLRIPNLEYPHDRFEIVYGDSLRIKPEIEAPANMKYSLEWVIKDSVVSTENILNIPKYNGALGYNKCKLIVTDKEHGFRYFFPFAIDVLSRFKQGWLVLSQKEGEAHLLYIREKTVMNEDEEEESIEFLPCEDIDVSSSVNPEKIVEHWSTEYSSMGQVFLLSSEGESFDMDGNNLKKVVSLKQEFMHEKFPENFKPEAITYLNWNSYIISGDRKFYNRRVVDAKGYNTGLYLHLPVNVPGGLEVEKIIPSRYVKSYQALIYNTANDKRSFMLITDQSQYSPDYAGHIKPIVYTKYPDNFAHLDNLKEKRFVDGGFIDGSYGNTGYFIVLQSDSDHKYYIQDFSIRHSYGSVSVSGINYATEFPGNLYNQNSKLLIIPYSSLVFFSSGNKVYYLDRALKDKMKPEFYMEFKAPVASMSYHKSEDRIGIGLENGDIHIMDVSVNALSGVKEKELFKYSNNIGKIKDVIFKYGSRNVFEYPQY